jgi:iron-sulfur cluster repair protein YtfE (RIC family)
MRRLIEELKREHAAISEALGDVRHLGIGSAAGQARLLAARTGLMAHLRKEDLGLYPALRRAAASDRALQDKVDFFARDMDEISKSALAFFDRYAAGGSGVEFAADFGTLSSLLRTRIHKEETILYPEYEKRHP